MDGYPKRQTKRLSYVELEQKYHMDPRTAKRYAESPQKPEYIGKDVAVVALDKYAGGLL